MFCDPRVHFQAKNPVFIAFYYWAVLLNCILVCFDNTSAEKWISRSTYLIAEEVNRQSVV